MCESGTNVTGLSSGKLSRSFDRHLLKLYWLMKRVEKKNGVWSAAISGGRPLISYRRTTPSFM